MTWVTLFIPCVLHLTAGTSMVILDRQPYGLLMCKAACQVTSGCDSLTFFTPTLRCIIEIYGSPSAWTGTIVGPNYKSTTIDGDQKTYLTPRDCPRGSMLILSARKEMSCVRYVQRKRHLRRRSHSYLNKNDLKMTPDIRMNCKNLYHFCKTGKKDQVQKALFNMCENGNKYMLLTYIQTRPKCHLKSSTPYGETILHRSAKYGFLNVLKCVLKTKSVSLETRTKNGDTAIMLAAGKGNGKAFNLLLKAGSRLDGTDDSGLTLLHKACKGENMRIVKRVLSYGLDIDAPTEIGHTPAMVAARLTSSNTLSLLVDTGCDTNKVDKFGQNILHLALKFQRVDNIKLILSRDLVDKEVKDSSGKSAIMVAASEGYYRVFKILLDHGCGVEGEDRKGNTIVQLACQGGSRFIVKELLKTVNAEMLKKKNNLGKRPDCLDKRNKPVSRKNKIPRIS